MTRLWRRRGKPWKSWWKRCALADDNLPAVWRPFAHGPPLTALQGLVKNIGVSNCSILKIQQLLKTATIKPAVNQVRLAVSRCRRGNTPYSMLGLHRSSDLAGRDPPLLAQRQAEGVLQNRRDPRFCILPPGHALHVCQGRHPPSPVRVLGAPPSHTHEQRYPRCSSCTHVVEGALH